MQHVVLDGGGLTLALAAESQGAPEILKLLELGRENTVAVWVHPHTVTDCLARFPAAPRAAGCAGPGLDPATRMAELMDWLRLLPCTGKQLKHVLAHAGGRGPTDILLDLTVAAATEYLEAFLLVGAETAREYPGGRVLSPGDCLNLAACRGRSEETSFVDLKTQQHTIYPDLEANIFEVLKDCRFILGPSVERLEARLCEFVRTDHAVSCSSGTEALVLALMALDIGPGDAVFTTPFTFIATAGAVCLVGATPVFVDIDSLTFNLDPDKLEAAVAAVAGGNGGHPLPAGTQGLRPRAVITVDLFGLPADHGRISKIAARHGLVVIEDAAQSFGAEERGRMAGALGEIGCTSFFPAKPLGGYGEGGACFTDNLALAEAMRSIRVHGQGTSRYEHARLGTNARLDSLQAAILLAKMDVFPGELQRRTEVAARYTRLLSGIPGLQIPLVPEGFVSAWSQYSLLAEDEARRDACRRTLEQAGIPTMVYYPIPLHLQRVFAPQGYVPGDFPVAERVSRRIFSLPMHPYLHPSTQERIASILSASVLPRPEPQGPREH